MAEQTLLLGSYQNNVQPRNAVKKLKLLFLYRKSERRSTVAKETNIVKMFTKLTVMINVLCFQYNSSDHIDAKEESSCHDNRQL